MIAESDPFVDNHDLAGTVAAVNGHMEATTNGGPSNWVVCKFGGTSVGKFPVNIAGIIKSLLLRGHQTAVVCSARSSTVKVEGTTNRLLRAAREAESQHTKACHDIVEAIRKDHLSAATTYIESSENRDAYITELDAECKDLDLYLDATQRIGEISPRSLDTIMSKGEILAAKFLAAFLRDQGTDAEVVDLSNIVDPHAEHHVVDQEWYDSLAVQMAGAIKKVGDKVPVLTGYFGVVPGGLLSQIGRGYTDLCAALVAVGLHASELQVIKEVDGVFTADPRKVQGAQLLSEITPAEAAELTFYGSEVIHPYTMEQVIRARIPIRIKNVMNPEGRGTTIVPEPVYEDISNSETPPTSLENSGVLPSPKGLFRSRSSTMIPQLAHIPKKPTAITIKPKVLVLNVHSNRRSLSHGFFARIFGILDKWRLSVDLISTSQVHVSMALHSESALVSGDEDSKRIVDADLEGAVKELQRIGTVDIIDGMAILSLVGKHLRHQTGIAGKTFSVLGENNCNIEMISQGASEICISCVIDEKDAERALMILHTHIFLYND